MFTVRLSCLIGRHWVSHWLAQVPASTGVKWDWISKSPEWIPCLNVYNCKLQCCFYNRLAFPCHLEITSVTHSAVQGRPRCDLGWGTKVSSGPPDREMGSWGPCDVGTVCFLVDHSQQRMCAHDAWNLEESWRYNLKTKSDILTIEKVLLLTIWYIYFLFLFCCCSVCSLFFSNCILFLLLIYFCFFSCWDGTFRLPSVTVNPQQCNRGNNEEKTITSSRTSQKVWVGRPD